LVLVPVNHVAFLRSYLTQARRMLHPGVNFVWPFESVIKVKLPRGKEERVTCEFALGSTYRFDPPSYRVQTQDQIEVDVDLFAEYEIVDAERMVDYASHYDYRQILTDQTLEKCNELVSRLAAAQVNAATLNQLLRDVEWPAQFGLKIKSVGIQVLRFDPRMQELIRMKALGATPEQVLNCVGRKFIGDGLARGCTPNSNCTAAPLPVATAWGEFMRDL
jgi:regulator of protease activity HflC (stomatin/prohibitin superfamily)